MNNCRIPKDIIYGELVTEHCPVIRSTLHFKDEQLAGVWSGWYLAFPEGATKGEKKRNQLLEIRREGRKQREKWQISISHYSFICYTCKRDCHASTGLLKPIQKLLAKGQCMAQKDATIILRDKWLLPTTILWLCLEQGFSDGAFFAHQLTSDGLLARWLCQSSFYNSQVYACMHMLVCACFFNLLFLLCAMAFGWQFWIGSRLLVLLMYLWNPTLV